MQNQLQPRMESDRSSNEANSRCHTKLTSERDNVIVSNYNCKYVDKLKCFYTNTDTLLNKRSELVEFLSQCNLDIIAVT